MFRPGAVAGFEEPKTRGISFFTQMYGVRAIAIAALVITALIRARPGESAPLLPVLTFAAAVQAADVGISVKNRTPGVVGATLASLVHGASLLVLARRARGTPQRPEW